MDNTKCVKHAGEIYKQLNTNNIIKIDGMLDAPFGASIRELQAMLKRQSCTNVKMIDDIDENNKTEI